MSVPVLQYSSSADVFSAMLVSVVVMLMLMLVLVFSIDGDGCADRDRALVSCERYFLFCAWVGHAHAHAHARVCFVFCFRLVASRSYIGRSAGFSLVYGMLELKVVRAGSKEKTTERMCVCVCVLSVHPVVNLVLAF